MQKQQKNEKMQILFFLNLKKFKSPVYEFLLHKYINNEKTIEVQPVSFYYTGKAKNM